MVTLLLFFLGVLSLLTFSPEVTAFSYMAPWYVKMITVFTSMVSHGNWSHLIGNYVFGIPAMLYAEYILNDWKKFLKLFIYCGLAGHVGQLIFEQFAFFHSSGSIGSSAAIFGIYAFALARARGSKSIQVGAHLVIIYHVAIQALSVFYALVFPVGVGFAAHLGGIVAGLCWAYAPLAKKVFRSLKQLISR